MKYESLQFWTELPFRRRTIFLEVIGIVMGLVLLGTLIWPPVYRSTSKILVQDNRAQLLVSPGLQENLSNQPTVVSSPVSEQDLNSEVELLTSEFLIEQTLSDLPSGAPDNGALHKAVDLTRSLISLPAFSYDALHQVRPLTSREQLAIKLADKLSASVIKRSNIIELSFKFNDARWSQMFLSHLIERYLELHALVSHDPNAEQFFRNQAELLEARLHKSEQGLQAMQMQTGISDLSGQRAALVTQLSTFEAERRKTTAQAAATREQIASLERQLDSTSPRLIKESRIVQNLALQQIKPQVLQLEAERAELLSRYQPGSSRIREIDAKLASARGILNRENKMEVQETTTDINPVWVTLDSQLVEARTTAASLAANAAELNKQVEKYREELNTMSRDGLAVERQQRQVDSNKEAYLSYLRKGEEARAAQALNQSKILNVSIAQPANLPLRPDFPNVMLNLLVGLIAAAAFGLAAAYAEEQRDPKLYSARAIKQVSGLPAVAQLSDAL
ncbi:MAG: hypothetical protein Q7S58_09830 [Candidatus Binatus sp.]|uniref:GumC family protein n=1 Tax=Candidatus Binatus sp. TaxID=2811406 RepID=UPI002728B2EA|nr:hypothetical protein [Candidatus Binatus sp.]MDO8432695.1 hypothetical protein [Candidatus Binatus sp.]